MRSSIFKIYFHFQYTNEQNINKDITCIRHPIQFFEKNNNIVLQLIFNTHNNTLIILHLPWS